MAESYLDCFVPLRAKGIKIEPMTEVKNDVHPTDIINVQQVWGQLSVHGCLSNAVVKDGVI